MCIYVYVYICIYMYIYVYICIYMYIYVYICVYIYVCIYVYVYVSLRIYKYVLKSFSIICIYVLRVCIYIYMYYNILSVFRSFCFASSLCGRHRISWTKTVWPFQTSEADSKLNCIKHIALAHSRRAKKKSTAGELHLIQCKQNTQAIIEAFGGQSAIIESSLTLAVAIICLNCHAL